MYFFIDALWILWFMWCVCQAAFGLNEPTGLSVLVMSLIGGPTLIFTFRYTLSKFFKEPE